MVMLLSSIAVATELRDEDKVWFRVCGENRAQSLHYCVFSG